MESPYRVRLSETGRRGAESPTPSTTPWSPFLAEEGWLVPANGNGGMRKKKGPRESPKSFGG